MLTSSGQVYVQFQTCFLTFCNSTTFPRYFCVFRIQLGYCAEIIYLYRRGHIHSQLAVLSSEPNPVWLTWDLHCQNTSKIRKEKVTMKSSISVNLYLERFLFSSSRIPLTTIYWSSFSRTPSSRLQKINLKVLATQKLLIIQSWLITCIMKVTFILVLVPVLFTACIPGIIIVALSYYHQDTIGISYSLIYWHTTTLHFRLGYDFDKPAGPLRLTAFLEALRRVNEEWTEHLKAALTNLCKGANTPNVVATKILQLLTENRHFADVSSQIHFGDEVPPERANFHNDGPNSALHVALSINGRRSLFWRGSKDPAFRNEADVYSCNPTGYDTHEEKQSPGRSDIQLFILSVCDDIVNIALVLCCGCDCYVMWSLYSTFLMLDLQYVYMYSVYLSSPFIVSHGVGYTQSSWEERIIAVQCRCLFTRAEINAFQEATEYEWRATMEAVSACVGRRRHDQHPSHSSASHPPAETSVSFRPYLFRLPSMAEVKLVHDELLPLWGQQHGQHEHSSGECEKVAETGTSSATSSNQHGISEY